MCRSWRPFGGPSFWAFRRCGGNFGAGTLGGKCGVVNLGGSFGAVELGSCGLTELIQSDEVSGEK